MEGHWSCTCRTPKHLVDSYQASIKKRKRELKRTLLNTMVLKILWIIFIFSNGGDMTHLDIETSILHQNSFIHMSSRRVAILMSSRYDYVIIWLICSLSHYQLQLLRRWCTTLAYINLRIFLSWTMEILCTYEGE